MTAFSDPHSPAYARVAGLGYLVIAVAGGFSIAYMPSVVFAPDLGQTLLQRIAEHRALFLWGIGGDVVMMLAELMVTAMLFFMFRAAHPTLSLIAALARFAMVAVMAAMLLFYAGLAGLAAPGLAFVSFSPEQTDALAHLLLYIHDSGVWVWQLFFAAHLAALGALILRSGLYPRLLGWGLALGGLGYALDSLYAFALPEAELIGQLRIGLLALVTVSEVGFALWLVFKGPQAKGATLKLAHVA